MKSNWGRKDAVVRVPASPRVMAGLLLLVALAVAYHGAIAGTLQAEFQSWFGVSGLNQSIAPSVAAVGSGSLPGGFAACNGSLDQISAAATTGDWATADAAMAVLENTWNLLSERLAAAGTHTGTINGVSAEIGDLSAQVSQRNLSGTKGDVNLIKANLRTAGREYAAVEAPSFSRIQATVDNLNQAVAARDWNTVQKDAAILSKYVQTIQQGF